MSVLGKGSYGEVIVRGDKAVKTFSKLSHLIQEYLALQYLKDCKYVVHAKGVDFGKLELHMELYDCSLKKWIDDSIDISKEVKFKAKMKFIHDIISGLVEFHDRGLAHGDIKPGNVLVKKNPVRAVLGDCGFVSIAKYAKVDRTAAIYRDPIIDFDMSHDMFSIGICMLEMFGELRIGRQASYDELKQVIATKIDNVELRKIIYNLLHSDKERRPSSRELLNKLFSENPEKWSQPNIILDPNTFNTISQPNLASNTKKDLRELMKSTAQNNKINRGKKGFTALLAYIDKYNISESDYQIYALVVLMILSSVFGAPGFNEKEIIHSYNRQININSIHSILDKLLSDNIFLDIVLLP